MAILVNDNCEDFTSAPWTVTGSPTIAAGFTGNGFSFPSGSSNHVKYSIASGDRSTRVTIGLHVKFGTLGSHDFVRLYTDAGANNQTVIRLNANGSLSLYTPVAVHGSSSPGSIATGTWYYVEASIELSNTVGVAILKIDGTTIFTATNQDTLGVATVALYDTVGVHSTGSIATWLADDIYIRNDATFGTAPDGTATPAAITLAATLPAATFSGAATPAATALAATFPAPTAAGITDGTATPAAVSLAAVVARPSLTINTVLDGSWGPMTASMAAGVHTPVEAVLAGDWGAMTADMVPTVSARIEAVLAASW